MQDESEYQRTLTAKNGPVEMKSIKVTTHRIHNAYPNSTVIPRSKLSTFLASFDFNPEIMLVQITAAIKQDMTVGMCNPKAAMGNMGGPRPIIKKTQMGIKRKRCPTAESKAKPAICVPACNFLSSVNPYFSFVNSALRAAEYRRGTSAINVAVGVNG